MIYLVIAFILIFILIGYFLLSPNNKPSDKLELFSGEEAKVVEVSGKIYFKIYKTGNDKYYAQHRSGEYLHTGLGLISVYEYAMFFSTFESAESRCLCYIRNHESRLVGFIQVVK